MGAGVVASGATVDKGDRSARIIIFSGVLPGTCYALCQHVWRINAQGKESPIGGALRFDDLNITKALISCKPLYCSTASVTQHTFL